MIFWPYLLISQIAVLLAYPLVPVAVYWADQNGRLPRVFRWLETFDNLGWSGPLSEPATRQIYEIKGQMAGLRAWDDGRGVDSGRGFGTAQSSQNLSHTHTFSGWTDTQGAHNHTFTYSTQGSGGTHAISATLTASMTAQWPTTTEGAHSHNVGGTIGANGGTEARPRNIAFLACIKF